jgi:PAS domain S-box-containing protein
MGRMDRSGVAARIRLFGPIEVEVQGRRLGPRDLGGVKPKQVLEILLSARGHPVVKDRLAENLWGEELPQNQAAALETHVSVLRRHLEPDRRHRRLILTEPRSYRFANDAADVDLDRFDELLERAAESQTESRRLLEEAIALARGSVLEDEPYAPWALRTRERYQQLLVQALLDAAEAALADRDFRPARDHAASATDLDPLNERAYRLLMMASYGVGEPGRALETYTRCRRLLAEELGVDPLEETEALYLAILRREDPQRFLPTRITRATPGFRRLVEHTSAAGWWSTDGALVLTDVGGVGVVPGLEAGRSGVHVGDLLPDAEDRDALVSRHAQALVGAQVTYELRIGDRTILHHLEPVAGEGARSAGVVGVALDVTGSRLVAAALAEDQAWRDAYEEAPVAYVFLDATGRFTRANRRAREVLGYDEQELRGLHLSQVHPDAPEGRRRSVALWERVSAGDEAGGEFDLLRPGGDVVRGRLWAQPLLDEAGAFAGVRVIIGELPAPSDEDERFDDAEARLRRLYEDAPMAYLAYDAELRVVSANRRARALLAYTLAELRAMHGLDLVAPEDLEGALERHRRAMAGEAAPATGVPVRLTRSDGRVLRTIGTSRAVFDSAGKLAGTQTMFEELPEGAEIPTGSPVLQRIDPNAVVDREAPTSFVYLDPAGRIQAASRRAAELLRVEPERLIGASILEFYLVPTRVDLERLRAGEELRGEPREFRRGDGSVTVLRRWARALHSGDGDVVGIFAMLEDMTQTLAAERRRGPGAFRSVFEEHSEPLFVLDPDHDEILDANPPACLALGYSREELLATPVSVVHPEEMPRFVAFMRSATPGGAAWDGDHFTCTRKDGTTFPAQFAPIRVDYGQRPSVLVHVRLLAQQRHADPGLRRRLQASRPPARF